MKNHFVALAAFLDKKAFLSSRLWQFSLLNIFRDYPYYFFFAAVLRHPVQSWRGFTRYRCLVQKSNSEPLSGTIQLNDLGESVGDQRFIIAPGFCMKPYDYDIKKSTCPAGHFNHECRLLNDLDLLHQFEKWPKPCRHCGIAPLALKAVEVQADFYIMTSALDIAKDVYIPALQNRGARYGLFFLCPYSLEPFTFGLCIAGINGVLAPFCQGDCSTHEEWTRADLGQKNDQTFLADDVRQEIFNALDELTNAARFKRWGGYEYDGHVYRAL